jgi:TRAP-type mannitol/chloroaromatic compound transport system substrate-binding protein
VIEEFGAQGVEIRRFPDPVLQALRQASTEVLEEAAAKDPIFKEAYDSMLAYQASSKGWNDLQALTVPE